MTGSRARTFVTNLGPTRRLSYVPPNGQEVASGATVVVPGVLETELILGMTEGPYQQYLDDLSADLVEIAYDFLTVSGQPAIGLTSDDKELVPFVTSGNGQDTGVTITSAPSSDGNVEVFLNGVRFPLGNGVKTRTFYFSSDGGVTARPIAEIHAGDALYFNGLVAGFDLDGIDRISLVYIAVSSELVLSSSSSSSSLSSSSSSSSGP